MKKAWWKKMVVKFLLIAAKKTSWALGIDVDLAESLNLLDLSFNNFIKRWRPEIELILYYGFVCTSVAVVVEKDYGIISLKQRRNPFKFPVRKAATFYILTYKPLPSYLDQKLNSLLRTHISPWEIKLFMVRSHRIQ